jgi:hypothetical protein
VVDEFRYQELVAKTVRMRFAPEKNEESTDFGISVDYDAVSKAQVGYDGATEFGAIAISA